MQDILIIEDQEGCWRMYEKVLVENMKISRVSIHRARWYTEALTLMCKKSYGIAILDHRLPFKDPECTHQSNSRQYVPLLQDIGYLLVDYIRIRYPKTVIIGTEPPDSEKIVNFGVPHFHLNKLEMDKELPRLLKKIRTR